MDIRTGWNNLRFTKVTLYKTESKVKEKAFKLKRSHMGRACHSQRMLLNRRCEEQIDHLYIVRQLAKTTAAPAQNVTTKK